MLTQLSSVRPTCPVSIDWLRRHARVDDPTDLDLLQLYADSATDFLEKYLGRAFITRNFTWTFSRDESYPVGALQGYDYITFPLLWNWVSWQKSITLPRVATTVSSVILNYWDNPNYTLTPNTASLNGQYQVDLSSTPGRIKFNQYDQVIYKTSSVTINFTSGYGAASDVPNPILHAVLLLATQGFENRGDEGFENTLTERVFDLVANERLPSFGGQML